MSIYNVGIMMTYIFNTGGHLPETMHCLMMRGKLFGWTKEDALSLSQKNILLC